MANASGGKKGRFAERLKKMRINRLKRKKGILVEDAEVAYKNFLKIISVIPLVVVGNVFDKPTNKESSINNDNNDISNSDSLTDEHHYFYKKKVDRKKIEDIDVSLLKKRQNAVLKSVGAMQNISTKETNSPQTVHFTQSTIDKVEYVKKLEKQILDIIHTDMLRMVNELEIYESELYLINEINTDEKSLDECRENIAKVKSILEKIEALKSRYDYLKDNYDFEYLLESNNENLIDKIIELRNIIGNGEIKATVDDYKLLDAYKYLYLKVDEVHTKTLEIESKKLQKVEELKARDIDFESLRKSVYNVEKIKNQYDLFVQQQNKFLLDLQDKLSKINSYDSVSYRIKGYGRYVLSSMKYLGLLAINPLKGLAPGILTETIIAKNAVSNMRKNLLFEERHKMVYEAIDYSKELSDSLYNLSVASDTVDNALQDLASFRKEYNEKFKQYSGDFWQYRDINNKIDDLQRNMINSKMKIEFMKSRALEYDRENAKTMGKVRRLNAMSKTTVIDKKSA